MVGPDAMSEERAGENSGYSGSWTTEDSIEHVLHAITYERCSWDEDPESRGFEAYIEDHSKIGIPALSNLKDSLEDLLELVNGRLDALSKSEEA